MISLQFVFLGEFSEFTGVDLQRFSRVGTSDEQLGLKILEESVFFYHRTLVRKVDLRRSL